MRDVSKWDRSASAVIALGERLLTQMSDNRVPLRVIQEASGHGNLEQLQAYMEVRNEQVLGAVILVDFPCSPLSPSPKNIDFPD